MPATLRPRLQKAPPPATAAPKETRGRKRNRGGRLTKAEEEQKERRREAYLRRHPPGAITTQPDTKIVFNTPYDVKHTFHIRIINTSCRRIGWAIKTTNMKRLGVDPACGVLDPKEATLMAVSCDAFAYGQKDTNNDRITIEWTNTPDGVAKQFRPEWLQRGDWPVGRKDLPIEYNP